MQWTKMSLNGVFLKRESSLEQNTFVFVINKNDEALFSKEDAVMKLPVPRQVGGTARRGKKFTFSCDFSHCNFFLIILLNTQVNLDLNQRLAIFCKLLAKIKSVMYQRVVLVYQQ